MESTKFDAVVRSLRDVRSRRGMLSGLASGLVTFVPLALSSDDVSAKHKRHKKKSTQTVPDCPTCPTCPTLPEPPSAPFCAGKNDCAQTGNITCQASGEECFCFIRQDNASAFCGSASTSAVNDCSACAAGEVCVIFGGKCVAGFGCSRPCPNPL
jgi:hypothetical protein